MSFSELLKLSWRTIGAHKMRSSLTAFSLIIGVAAVVILTSIGQGIHRFVLTQFTQFGSNLMAVVPGKTTTFGLSGATISTVRPLSLDDAYSLKRLDNVRAVMPMVQGNARIEFGAKQRRANVFGVGVSLPEVWQIKLSSGRFLPDDAQSIPRAFAVLGSKLRAELFVAGSPLGQRITIGNERYRVIGVMAPKGQMLGFDLDDTVFIAAGKALEMFDRQGVMEIDVLYDGNVPSATVERAIKRLLVARHGREDFTLITQSQMLATLDSILSLLTLAIGALGGISLLVGSVGVFTIMTIAVSERVSEIGLLRAIGAERRIIFRLFLSEALALSAVGGLGGIVLGITLVQILDAVLPALPVQLAWAYIGAAFVVSLLIGAAAGVIPAMKAAAMKPLEALRTE
ncbi:MAG: peptide ABC transporter permease [Gammaproteobacteria bacterium HGW-Gammaproteobacteria-3]|nr:MAG: peptide ABC transporter permease [Gammaproteobacteria bacterium HGW-Gammaproteobacteria-3]